MTIAGCGKIRQVADDEGSSEPARMRDFHEENGCLVRWEPCEVLAESSLLVLLLPVVTMVFLAWLEGMMSLEDLLDFLSKQNQFNIAACSMLLVFLIVRLILFRGVGVIFDRANDELRRVYEFRFGLRWVERWRLSDIASVAVVPPPEGPTYGGRVVITFKRDKDFVVEHVSHAPSGHQTVQRLKTYLGL